MLAIWSLCDRVSTLLIYYAPIGAARRVGHAGALMAADLGRLAAILVPAGKFLTLAVELAIDSAT